MQRILVITISVLVCLSSLVSAAEQRTHSHKWKAIMTSVGVGGGLVLGTMWGIGAYDDAINSDQKVNRVIVAGGLIGGALGFLLGMHMDNSRAIHETNLMPEIRWESATSSVILSQGKPNTGHLTDADPLELLARAAITTKTQRAQR